MAILDFLASFGQLVAVNMKSVAASADDIAAATAKLAASATSGLDDAATIAAKGSSAVVADDIPVSQQAMTTHPSAPERTIRPDREKYIVGRIFRHALITRLVLTPLTRVISNWVPAYMPVIVGVGGAYLAYEGSETVLHGLGKKLSHIFNRQSGHDQERSSDINMSPNVSEAEFEKAIIGNGTTKDAIMGTEISFIGNNAIEKIAGHLDEVAKFAGLGVSNLAIVGLTYLLIYRFIRMDDDGVALSRIEGDSWRHRAGRWIGRNLPDIQSKLSTGLSYIGTAAMLWIGGELSVPGISALAHNVQGLQAIPPYADAIMHAVHQVAHVAESIGGRALGWLAEAGANALVGLGVGSTLIAGKAVMHLAKDGVNMAFDRLDRVPGMDTPSPIPAAARADVDGEFLGLEPLAEIAQKSGTTEAFAGAARSSDLFSAKQGTHPPSNRTPNPVTPGACTPRC